MKKLTYLFVVLLAVTACSVESFDSADEVQELNRSANIKSTKSVLDTPIVTSGVATENTLQIVVTAGNSGAPEGFKFRWMTKEDFDLYGWVGDEACQEMFQVNPQFDNKLDPNESAVINLEDYINGEDGCLRFLECGLGYYFSVQANNVGGQPGSAASDWSAPFFASTASCEPVCAYGKGYWKNHGPDNPGNQEDMYPIDELEIGSTSYSKEDLQTILKNTGNVGPVQKMFHHLIAVLLNIENGVDGSNIVDTVVEAVNILEADGEGYSKEEINSIKDALEQFNEANGCDDYEDHEDEDVTE